MDEQKYYVKLKSPNKNTPIYWCGKTTEWKLCPYIKVRYIDDYDTRNFEEKIPEWVPSFTKSELAEVMDGALYKHKFRSETTEELYNNGWVIRKDRVYGATHWEWINPLIELIPAEGEKNGR